MDVVIRADDAGDLLVEEHGVLGRVHSRLGDVVGVIQADGQELAGLDGRQQANVLERVALGGVVAMDEVPVLDDPWLRPGAGVKAAELHEFISGISTGACSGAYPPAIALAWISSKLIPSA